MAVEPEEAERCAHQGAAEDRQLAGPFDVGDPEVVGDDRVAGGDAAAAVALYEVSRLRLRTS